MYDLLGSVGYIPMGAVHAWAIDVAFVHFQQGIVFSMHG
jgi:hypothetical protein